MALSPIWSYCRMLASCWAQVPHQRSSVRLGYYAWKPLVISKALTQIDEGSMLLFMDANMEKYKAPG